MFANMFESLRKKGRGQFLDNFTVITKVEASKKIYTGLRGTPQLERTCLQETRLKAEELLKKHFDLDAGCLSIRGFISR